MTPRPARRILCLLAALAVGAAVPLYAADSPAGGAGPAARTEFESFRLIFERNIFNPNRSARSSGEGETRREPERRVRTESFALVGTMSYEKGRFAFFDGSSSDYRKVLRPTETIAGYTVAEVAPAQVILRGTNQHDVVLPVGMQMQRHDEGEWTLAARADGSGGSAAAGAAAENSDVLQRMLQRREREAGPEPQAAAEPPVRPAPSATAAPNENDEVLKRLLQKREQELQK